MGNIGNPLYIAMVAWIGAGLLLEAMLALRQWRYLTGQTATLAHGAAAARRRRYGQRRALFGWLARVEQALRLAIWVPGGLLAFLHSWFVGLGLGGSVIFFVLFAVGDRLLRQPLIWARWGLLERRFDVSRMGAADMLRDTGGSLALQAGLAAAAAVWLLWPFAIGPAPLAWPVSGALAVLGFAIGYWVKPNMIAPLFNRFEPLPGGALRARLEAMMRRCGARLDTVLVMDGSRRSNLANAYFTGLGRSKRIVLFDTLIERLEAFELEAVLAHELGHYRCGHLRRYYGLLGCLLWLAFVLVGLGCDALGGWHAPAAEVAVIYLLLPVLAWPLTPWLALLRRRYEYEADAFAARHASAAGLVSALEKLLAHNLNTATMDRWYAGFYATHPPGEARVARLA